MLRVLMEHGAWRVHYMVHGLQISVSTDGDAPHAEDHKKFLMLGGRKYSPQQPPGGGTALRAYALTHLSG